MNDSIHSSVLISYNGKITKPSEVPTLKNDTFLGWFLDKYAVTPLDFNTYRVTAKTNIYAGWKSITDKYIEKEDVTPPTQDYDYYDSDYYPVTFNVQFDENYDGGTVNNFKVASGRNAYYLDSKRSGYKLLAWMTKDNQLFDFSTKITTDLMLFAKWEESSLINITFDTNIAGEEVIVIEHTRGQGLKAPDITQHPGFVFDHWVDKTTGKKVDLDNLSIITDTVLLAKYKNAPGFYLDLPDSCLSNMFILKYVQILKMSIPVL